MSIFAGKPKAWDVRSKPVTDCTVFEEKDLKGSASEPCLLVIIMYFFLIRVPETSAAFSFAEMIEAKWDVLL